ncbi:MAG TPA: hypothetical protein VLK78_04625 [Candidatus Angelobacter sp.]|nr:hypothetical protein [Candidatus Angelobacter sp.]
MNYNWTVYRTQELSSWKAELEDMQKGLEVEMEKHQKIREKYRLRFQVALQTKPYLSSNAYEKAIALHKKKQEQVSQDVQQKLQTLIQQLETINAFKKAIDDTLEADLNELPELELEKKSPQKKGSSKKGHSKMKLSKRKVLQD